MRPHPNRAISPRRVRQRGALLFTAPLLMLLVVLLSVMALDGARLYSLREKMQTQVDAAATAAADADQTCGGQDVSLDTMKARALSAAQAQGFSGSAADLDVQAGVLESPQKGQDLAFQPTAYLDQSNAVRVSYKKTARISQLLPQSWLGGVTLSVNAAVRKQAVATLSAAGSTVNIGGGLLGALLGAVLSPGTPYNLDPTSLSSLQNTTVRLGDLLDALHVNDAAALLPLSGQDLANGLDTIATNKGLTGVATLLDNIASANGIDTVKVSDVLNVVGSTSVPPNSQFPLYDAVISLVLNIAKINQTNSNGLLSVPLSISGLNIPGVASVNVPDLELHVGNPPKVAIGPALKDSSGNWVTRFYAPDITLSLDANVQLLNILGLSIAKISLPLAVAVGGGTGDLVAVDCARGSDNSAVLTVRLDRQPARIMTGALNAGDGTLNPGNVEVDLLGILNNPVVKVTLGSDTKVLGETQDVTLTPGYPLYCSASNGCEKVNLQDNGAGISGLDLGLQVKNVDVLGLNLSALVNPILQILTPILNQVVGGLADTVINPLLQGLGVGLGGISVTVSNVDQNSIQIIENVPLAS